MHEHHMTVRNISREGITETSPADMPSEYKGLLTVYDLNGQKVTLSIKAGSVQMALSEATWPDISDNDGFMLVFRIESHQSFRDMETLYKTLRLLKGKDPLPMALVGIGNAASARQSREVSFAKGLALANSFGCQYAEVDTDMGTGAENPFAMVIHEIRDASRTMKYHWWLHAN